MNKNQNRKINKTFSIRLHVLEKFEESTPKGEQSEFLEKLLIRELTRTNPVTQAQPENKKPQNSRTLDGEGTWGLGFRQPAVAVASVML